ncbi:hypothetical protein FRY97_11485 [Phaeodactylibacter luteus]|uniref:START domain-containing protein n=2 Tax=Phaeodactylibacter luteus TaxID=1564516 RepID=A0A5C6RKT2_9BACT|nr:hypothetical protein FRY97_11485 [Phaeodactylibacter luteus]
MSYLAHSATPASSQICNSLITRNMNFKLLYLLLAVCTAAPSAFAQAQDWSLKRDTDGMQVYLRDVPGSPIKQIKIEATLNASLDAVVSVLKDIDAYQEWIYKCQSAKRLQPSTQNSSHYYCRVDFPWPMSDRDFIAKSKLWQDENDRTVYIEVEGLPNDREPVQDVVRIPELKISYALKPLPNEQVQMTYILHSDPAGDIPTWLVNMVVDNGPLNTVKGMREMLKKDAYRQASLSYLK